MLRRTLLAPVLLVAVALLVGCGGANGGGQAAPTGPATAETAPEQTAPPIDPIEVVASFYPLQWVAEQVGGDRVVVTNLVPPGTHAHGLELSPGDVGRVTEAELVVYLSGFQPAVDEAVVGAQGTAFDVAPHANLTLVSAHGHGHGHDHGHDEGHGHDAGAAEATDPHFWLDPMRLADVADALAVTLGSIDPDNAEQFNENAADLRGQLTALDQEYQTALADCTNRVLVTTHTSFAYLADRYGFSQLGISGISPHDEPSPADLASVTEFVRDNQVTTIYLETLASPAIAQTVASETGATTSVLDPIEGLNDMSQGENYLEIMRSNLSNLVAGQNCA